MCITARSSVSVDSHTHSDSSLNLPSSGVRTLIFPCLTLHNGFSTPIVLLFFQISIQRSTNQSYKEDSYLEDRTVLFKWERKRHSRGAIHPFALRWLSSWQYSVRWLIFALIYQVQRNIFAVLPYGSADKWAIYCRGYNLSNQAVEWPYINR